MSGVAGLQETQSEAPVSCCRLRGRKSRSCIIALHIVERARNVPHVPFHRLGPVLKVAAFLLRSEESYRSSLGAAGAAKQLAQVVRKRARARSKRVCVRARTYVRTQAHTLRLPLKVFIISSH
jgi:hypothetical protein